MRVIIRNGSEISELKPCRILRIVDTTLRDGDQSPGVAFSISDKISIAKALDDLGVDVIEAGIPAMGKMEMDAIYEILSLNLKAEILTWNRMRRDDVLKSLDTGAKNIHISIPSSDLHIYKKVRMSRKTVLEEMERLIELIKGHGCQVSIGAEDASRADESFLMELYKKAESLSVKRIRYADTVSILDPFTAKKRIDRISSKLKTPLDFHGHNDFGLGTANALGAFKGGASFISCSINGLGERAGNTALEEIVLAMKYMGKCDLEISIEKLYGVSQLVEKLSGRRIHESKPVVGSMVFSHESGIHVDGLLKDPETYEYLQPSILGRERKFVTGKHSGKHRL